MMLSYSTTTTRLSGPVVPGEESVTSQSFPVEKKVVSKLSEVEASIVEQARVGDTNRLIEYVYSLLRPHALRQVMAYREVFGLSLDLEDVIQVGALQVVKDCKKALKAANPISLLRHSAYLAMIRYCKEGQSPIRVPYSTQWEHRGERDFFPPFVDSLEALIFNDRDETTCLLTQLAAEPLRI